MRSFIAIALLVVMAGDSVSAEVPNPFKKPANVLPKQSVPEKHDSSNKSELLRGKDCTDHSPDISKKVVPPPETSGKSSGETSGKTPAPIDKTGIWLRVYTARDCGKPCHSFLDWRERQGSTIGCDVEHLQFESVGKASDQFPDGVPRFELYRGNKLLGSRTGWSSGGNHRPGELCPDCLRNWVQQASGKPVIRFDNQAELKVAARAVRVPFKMQVAQAFGVLKQARISSFAIRWHCADGKRSIRVAGRNKAPVDLLAVAGGSGHIDFEAPGSLLPNGKVGFGYRVLSNDEVEIDADPVRFSLRPQAPGASASEKCGFGPLTILSALVTIMNLINSHCDAILPPDMQLAGTFSNDNALDVNITRGNPELLLTHLWTSESKLTHFGVTLAGARADLVGSRLLPRKLEILFD